MKTWIALFRGINVGGRNTLPMVSLKLICVSAGCSHVRSYIQSGNVVFTTATKSIGNLCKRLQDSIEHQFGFRPDVFLISEGDFRAAVKNNPFPVEPFESKTVHFFFLDSQPDAPDLEGIRKLARGSERFKLLGNVFYLHAPDGFGRSRLPAVVERKLGQPATARNFSTIQSLIEMLDAEYSE